MIRKWTIRRETLRTCAVFHRGAKCGEMTLHLSGHVDWTFAATGPRPSRTTQRRLLADARRRAEP